MYDERHNTYDEPTLAELEREEHQPEPDWTHHCNRCGRRAIIGSKVVNRSCGVNGCTGTFILTTTNPTQSEEHTMKVPRTLFEAEIANERSAGVSPATLSSAIESVLQAPDYVLAEFFDGEVVEGLMTLLSLRDRFRGSTSLSDLL